MENSEQSEVSSLLMCPDPTSNGHLQSSPDRQDGFSNDSHEDDETTGSEDDSTYSDMESESSKVSSNAEGFVTDGALVYLRLRPVDTPSLSYNLSTSGNILITTAPQNESATTTANHKNAIEKHYSFSAIFDDTVQQEEIYANCIGQKIEAGESFTVLTYGTSGSGKTFTLLGDDDRPGIIPRSLEHIFAHYEGNIYPHPSLKLVKAQTVVLNDADLAKEVQLRRRVFGACSDINVQHSRIQQTIRKEHAFQTIVLNDMSVLIWVSFVEIYNECVYDLLEPPPTQTPMNASANVARKNLKIVGNDGKVFVKDLTTIYVKSSLEALQLLLYGLQRVTYASTSVNANSSRSHCVFSVDVLKFFGSGVITETSYKFCDLAGSERVVKTKNVGSRLKEAQRINTSLMVLGRCLDAASSGGKKRPNDMIPFRESRLTMLLQSALLGKEKLAMIVNVTPTDKYFEENLNVLGFASIAKNIIFKQPVSKPKNSRYSFFIEQSKSIADVENEYTKQLLEENIALRSELEGLNAEIQDLKSHHAMELLIQEQELRNKLVDSFQETLSKRSEQFENRLRQELEHQQRAHDLKIAALERRHQEEIEDLREELEEDVKENVSGVGSPRKRRTLN